MSLVDTDPNAAVNYRDVGMRLALAGMRDLNNYLKGVDLGRVRAIMTG